MSSVRNLYKHCALLTPSCCVASLIPFVCFAQRTGRVCCWAGGCSGSLGAHPSLPVRSEGLPGAVWEGLRHQAVGTVVGSRVLRDDPRMALELWLGDLQAPGPVRALGSPGHPGTDDPCLWVRLSRGHWLNPRGESVEYAGH